MEATSELEEYIYVEMYKMHTAERLKAMRYMMIILYSAFDYKDLPSVSVFERQKEIAFAWRMYGV